MRKPLIAGQGCAAYLRPVIAFLTRLMTLMALVLMPLGMGAAPAAAAMPAHHAMMPSGEAHHDAPADEPAGRSAECAMACSMLAPDEKGDVLAPEVPAEVIALRPTVQRTGLHPEMDPPPPKRS